jgi:acetyl esterase/lipase
MNAMIEDWDDAYANGAHIEGAEEYPARWAEESACFRREMEEQKRADCDIAYGDSERQRFDIFRPEGSIRGLVVFVHGGYWRAFDKSSWSRLATGPVSRGWAVVIPSYDLAPTVSIDRITHQIGDAISHAASLVDGPIRLAGHSAGGHLVARMMCADSPLAADFRQRIERVVSISGLHDLRPLLKTAMNDDFRMTEALAVAESPALMQPIENVELVCWVGADERPEFVRQSELLANIWTGFGIETTARQAPGQHHFNVIDGLADPISPLGCALLD